MTVVAETKGKPTLDELLKNVTLQKEVDWGSPYGGWQDISTAPKDGQFLVTHWELGDPWACEIELVNAPFLADGRILNQNSGNYTRAGHWTHWMPLPPPPRSNHEQQ